MKTTERIIWLLLVVVSSSIFIQCKSTREFLETDVLTDNTTEGQEEQAEIDIQYDNTLYGLCYALTNTIYSNDIRHIEHYFPDVSLARRLSPVETYNMSNQEIRDNMLIPTRERLEANIANIRKNATEKGLDHELIIFLSHEVQPREGEDMQFDVVTIDIGSDNIEGTVPVTFTERDGKFYIFEILISTNIFK